MKPVFTIFVSLCVLNCAPRAVTPDTKNTTDDRVYIAAVDAGVPQFGALRGARITVGLSTLDAALADWHFTPRGPCTLVFDEQTQWLVGCAADGLAGFEQTGERQAGAPIFFHPKALTIDTQYVPYEQAKMLVGRPASFRRSTDAGVEERPLLLMQDLEALARNHPGFQKEASTDEWLGIFVHESLHTYQFAHPTLRAIAGSLSPGLDDRALQKLYRSNAEFAASIDAEVKLLRDAFDTGVTDAAAAKKVLLEWSSHRRERVAKFAAEFPSSRLDEIEALYLFVEGTARYSEATFLRSAPTVANVLQGNDARFNAFQAWKGKPVSRLPGLSGGGDRYFYAMGMYVSFLLDVIDPSWKQTVLDDKSLLVGKVDRALK